MATLYSKGNVIMFFSIVIDFIHKNNKILMEAMKNINVTQLDGYNHAFKERLQFFKAQDKKVN
jgi:hypothetical protein